MLDYTHTHTHTHTHPDSKMEVYRKSEFVRGYCIALHRPTNSTHQSIPFIFHSHTPCALRTLAIFIPQKESACHWECCLCSYRTRKDRTHRLTRGYNIKHTHTHTGASHVNWEPWLSSYRKRKDPVNCEYCLCSQTHAHTHTLLQILTEAHID